MGGSTLAGAGRGGAGCGRLLVIQHLRYFRFLPHGHLSFLATIAGTFSPCYHVRFSFAIGKHETSANTMTVSRAHHYVPVFYLKGFTSPKDREYLWVYEQGKSVRKSKPVNEAHERDFYSFIDEDDQRRDLEQPLSRIESEIAPLFRAIDDGYHRLHDDDFEGLTIFMALLWVRGPFGKDFVNRLSSQVMKHQTKTFAEDADKFKKKYEEFLKESGTQTHLSAEEMRAFALSDNWEVEQTSHGYTLQRMFEGMPMISNALRQKPWEVLVSEGDNYFCTSDFPIVTVQPESERKAVIIGMGFEMPGVDVLFPLTKRACLRLRDRARSSGQSVNGAMVREINKILMTAARRFIYACEKNSPMEKLFSKIGCKSVPGVNAFVKRDPAPQLETDQP